MIKGQVRQQNKVINEPSANMSFKISNNQTIQIDHNFNFEQSPRSPYKNMSKLESDIHRHHFHQVESLKQEFQ